LDTFFGLVDTLGHSPDAIAFNKDQSIAFESIKHKILRVISLKNASKPKQKSNLDTGNNINAIAIDKNTSKIYISKNTDTFEVYDTNLSTTPTTLSTIEINDMIVKNDTILIASNNGLDEYNISSDTFVNKVSLPNLKTISLSSNQQSAYMVNDSNTTYKIDLNDYSYVTYSISSISISDIEVDNNNSIAYSASKSKGLGVFDISDESNISLISTYDLNDSINTITLLNNNKKAFLSSNTTMYIVSLVTPNTPVLLGKIDINDTISNISLNKEETLAYVSTNQGIKTIDILSDKIIKNEITTLRSYFDTDKKNTDTQIQISLSTPSKGILDINVTQDNNNTFILGDYNTSIDLSNTVGNTRNIKIPLVQKLNQTGTTIFTITISDDVYDEDMTRTVEVVVQ